MKKKKITLVFPILNFSKKNFLFIKELDKKFSKLDVKYLVVAKKISKKLNYKKKITFLTQKKPGFMNACFESIKHIKTKYCTFIYEDDIFSSEIEKLYIKVFRYNLSMGYGIVTKQIDNYFPEVKFKNIKSLKILKAYYGDTLKKVPYMPVSPICLIFKSIFLIEWKRKLIEYCKNNDFRKNFLLKKNIGPDLFIYLNQLKKKNNNKIPFGENYIVKFYMHKNSMSYNLGKNNLQIGYWLTKNYLVLNENFKKNLSNKFYTFCLLAGYFLLIKNYIFNLFGKDNFYNDIYKEIRYLKKKNYSFRIEYALKIILNKTIRLFR